MLQYPCQTAENFKLNFKKFRNNRSVLTSAGGEIHREAPMKINLLTGKYKDLSDAMGIKTKAERMQVSGYRPVKVPEYAD